MVVVGWVGICEAMPGSEAPPSERPVVLLTKPQPMNCNACQDERGCGEGDGCPGNPEAVAVSKSSAHSPMSHPRCCMGCGKMVQVLLPVGLNKGS